MREFHEIEMVSAETLARLLECHVATVWRQVKTGQLPAPIKIGGMTRWRLADIRARLGVGEVVE